MASSVQELQALRKQGGVAASPTTAAKSENVDDGLIVYYFHSNTRCPTCQSIESQSHETVQADFATQLKQGEITWKILNYEQAGVAPLAQKFEIQMPVVVLVKMKGGQVQNWKRLDEVWGLVGDKPAFAAYIRREIKQMLAAAADKAAVAIPADKPNPPSPKPAPANPPLPVPARSLPLPK